MGSNCILGVFHAGGLGRECFRGASLLAALTVTLFALLANAAIAQNYIVTGSGTANKNVLNTYSEVTTISTDTSTTIDGIIFQLFRVGGSPGSGTINVEIRNGTEVVASGSISRSTANTANTDYLISFVSPFTAVSGDTYGVFMQNSVNVNPSVSVKFSNTAIINAANTPPTAEAGANQNVASDAVVTLDGSGSGDPDTGDSISYAWTETSSTGVTLSGADTASPTFTAPSLAIGDAAVVLTFQLIVTDSFAAASVADTMTVTVTSVSGSPTLTEVEDAARTVTGAFIGRRMERLISSEPLAYRFDHRKKAVTRLRFSAASSDSTGDPVTKLDLSGRWLSGNRKTYVWAEGTASFYRDTGGTSDTRSGDFAIFYLGADYLVTPTLAFGVMAQIDSTRERVTSFSDVRGHGWMVGPYMTTELTPGLTFSLRAA